MRNLFKILFGLLLAVLSAVLITASFPPYNHSFLILFSFIPMLISQYRILPEKVSSLAPAVTIGGFLGFYLMGVFAPFDAWYMKAIPFIIGVITFFTDRWKVRSHRNSKFKWFVLDGVFSWVAIEFIRIFIPIFGTWAFLPYAFYNQPWFIQPVKIFSIFGLSILIMAVNYSLGLLFVNPSRKAGKVVIIILLIVISWVSLSLMLYRNASSETIKVGVIQANPYQFDSSIGSSPFRKAITDKLLDLSYDAVNKGAQVVLWPEGALDYDPKVYNSETFMSFAQKTNAYLIIPYIVFGTEGNRNEVTILSPQGKFLGAFGKDHPVVFAGETSITRGTYQAFETKLGSFGLVICYDLDFTDTCRKVAGNGAQVIFAPSGDWPQIAEKHYIHSVFRAVENGVSVVKAEWAYDSVVVDPFGRIISKIVSNSPKEAVIVRDVPLGDSKTIYSRTGDIVGCISLVMMIVIQILMNLENRKKTIEYKKQNKGRKQSEE